MKFTIDDIEKFIFSGESKKDIATKHNISLYWIEKLINDLKITNVGRYNSLIAKLQENVKLKRAEIIKEENKKLNSIFKNNSVNKYAKMLANGGISFLEAARQSNYTILSFIKYLNEVKNEEYANKLQQVLKDFNLDFRNESKPLKSLLDYSLQIREEIVLVALTYRVSLKTLAKLFHTTYKDIINLFISFDKLEDSLGYLVLETLNEDSTTEKVALHYATKYFQERKDLVLKKLPLNDLYAKIYDFRVFATIGKHASELTEEERDLIARYPVKYYVPIEAFAIDLKRDQDLIINCMESLAKRNPIFEDKVTNYKLINQSMSNSYIINTEIPFYNRTKPDTDIASSIKK